MEAASLLIKDVDVVLAGGGVWPRAAVFVSNGIIQAVWEEVPAEYAIASDITMVDGQGCWLTPGLIDQHLHGAFGINFNDCTLREGHQLLSMLPQHGITGVVPTVLTALKTDMMGALTTLEEVIHSAQWGQARVFALHCEGPFLSPQYRGAHPAQHLLELSQETLTGLLSPNVKRITIAPELDPDHQWIRLLSEQGVRCSLGHSGADYATALGAINAGASCATHMFNAMVPFHHRDPGLTTAILLSDDVFVEVIGDGVHVAPEVIQLLAKIKPCDKVILISDCNPLAGQPEGSVVQFGDQPIRQTPEGPVNDEGRLAGSSTLLTDALRYLVQHQVLTFPQAIQMATYHPALHLGEFPTFGQIAPQSVADMILWRQSDLAIQQVFVGGVEVPLTASVWSQDLPASA